MKIDIEKLNRKTPYPEPSDEFFKALQDQVISKTIGEKTPVVQKEAKVFSLNFKWMAAAAVVLIAGITAFFGLNENNKVDTIATQTAIVDTTYKLDQRALPGSSDQVANDAATQEAHSGKVKHNGSIASSHPKTKINSTAEVNNIDRQDYAVESKIKSESEVEKVLAAFTPDQLKDLDRNSEQDVYLDLYN
ncbi:hypothetical protein [Epilithonimonas arachidiradicis]|uniref:Uncharacterized protein n=1 Tax=Epilithonimonas arachidiradicis TaxID=1617282 RepID=A0A420DCD0_9FLAO|nr:hypothetical protein [Epilithonimonas arachidiradicis]RKE89502.1 hypothetical protein BXY58_0065 [Epilithonimonas arachidiradicis]GGG42915.1 hypothetical protein GCM10007332_00580 [Epilithonimonas arachidiradicis]